MQHNEISPHGRLQGKVALITGGTSGIGRSTALLFAQQEAAVAVAGQDKARGEQVVQELRAGGGRAIFLPVNVAMASDCQQAVERTIAEFGGLDILFNNAGIIHRKTVLELSEEEWDLMMAVNVKSVFLLSRAAIPHMLETGGGVIINNGSDWGLVGGPRAASYCASKGAVVQLTKAMAIDYGAYHIRVNCICPGDTATPMLRNEAVQLGESDENFLREAAQRPPLQRIGRPEDIAQAALYLASDESSFVTGTTLLVDGGGLAG
jgi:NAD(P)-dependent dehydrogenase (short-subunit alcohol dehydrogenase family)